MLEKLKSYFLKKRALIKELAGVDEWKGGVGAVEWVWNKPGGIRRPYASRE